MPPATYRQVSDTFSVICAAIDPSPVPSFRSVPDEQRDVIGRGASGIDTRPKRRGSTP